MEPFGDIDRVTRVGETLPKPAFDLRDRVLQVSAAERLEPSYSLQQLGQLRRITDNRPSDRYLDRIAPL